MRGVWHSKVHTLQSPIRCEWKDSLHLYRQAKEKRKYRGHDLAM